VGADKARAVTSPAPRSSVGAEAFGLACAIVERAPDAILVCDEHGRIMMANSQVEGLFGYDRDALVGAQVEMLPARLRSAHEPHRANYAIAPTRRPMGAGLELFGRHG